MIIKFECAKCKLKSDAEVPERARSLDIEFWINQIVLPRVGETHKTKSPFCLYDKVDLMIPAPDDAEFLGQKGHEKL